MGCKHNGKVLPFYARNQMSRKGTWISSKSICGVMIYVCMDCGAVLEKGLIKKKILSMKKEVN